MPQQEIIPQDLVSEGIRGVFELMPLVYILIVVMTVIALGIVDFRGEAIKYHKVWVLLTACLFAGVAYFLMPAEQVRVRDIPTLIIGAIASLFFVELFIFWRKRKTKKSN